MLDRRQVEAREMIELQPLGIGEHGAQVRRGIVAVGAEADQMLVAAPVRQLDDAEAIARGDEPHRLGIDGDRGAGGEDARGQVFLMKMNGHRRAIGKGGRLLNARPSPARAAAGRRC